MPQLSYTINTNAFIAGSIGFTNDFTSFTYANTLSALKPGYGVVLGSGPGLCKLPAASTDKFIGGVIRDLNFSATGLPNNPNTDVNVVTTYPVNSAISVMARGQLQVRASVAVTAGDAVYLIYKVNASVQTLVWSGDVITGNTIAGTVNGTALTSTAFNTSNAQTLTDLAAKIAAITGILSASSDGTHTITVTGAADVAVALTGFVITGGVSQATAAITTTQTLVSSDMVGTFINASGSALYGTAVAFQISTGARWLEASGTDPDSNIVAMLDINIPA